MELIKKTVRVGNSAGVLLPKEYLNSQVKITLQPLSIERDIFNILIEESLLPDIIGIYLTGSRARGEQTLESDVDVLIVTSKIERRIKKEKYDLLLIARKTLEEQLKKNALPLLPMIMEARPIVNKSLLDDYKKTRPTKKNLKWHFEIVKSGLKVCKAAMNINKEIGSKYMSDSIAYSLVLHLRSVYIVGSLIKNKIAINKELIGLVNKITGSNLVYEGYLRVKLDGNRRDNLPLDQAERLYRYLTEEIKKQEKWLRARRE